MSADLRKAIVYIPSYVLNSNDKNYVSNYLHIITVLGLLIKPTALHNIFKVGRNSKRDYLYSVT